MLSICFRLYSVIHVYTHNITSFKRPEASEALAQDSLKALGARPLGSTDRGLKPGLHGSKLLALAELPGT